MISWRSGVESGPGGHPGGLAQGQNDGPAGVPDIPLAGEVGDRAGEHRKGGDGEGGLGHQVLAQGGGRSGHGDSLVGGDVVGVHRRQVDGHQGVAGARHAINRDAGPRQIVPAVDLVLVVTRPSN